MYIGSIEITQHSEVCRGDGVVAGARCGGSAHVHASMLQLHVRDDQVPVSQHLGVEDVDGLVVRPAPGDERPGDAGSHALQDGVLV